MTSRTEKLANVTTKAFLATLFWTGQKAINVSTGIARGTKTAARELRAGAKKAIDERPHIDLPTKN